MKFSIVGFEDKIESPFNLDSNKILDRGTSHLKNLKGIDLAEISVTTVGPGRDENKIRGNNIVSDSVSIYNRINYNNTMLNTWNYMNFNVNAVYTFDTVGTKLIFSADYSPNWDDYTWNFDHHFLENDDEVAAPRIFRTFMREEVNLLSSKLDFEKKYQNRLLFRQE